MATIEKEIHITVYEDKTIPPKVVFDGLWIAREVQAVVVHLQKAYFKYQKERRAKEMTNGSVTGTSENEPGTKNSSSTANNTSEK